MGKRILYVTGFNRDTRARDLAHAFERYGRLVRCDIPSSRRDSNKLFAFIEYEDSRDAADAFDRMHDEQIDGSRISVQWAKRPPARSWRFEGGDDRRGGRRRSRSRSPSRSRSRSPNSRSSRRRHRSRSRSGSRGRRSPSNRDYRRDRRGSRDGEPRHESRERRRRRSSPSRSASREKREEEDRRRSRSPREYSRSPSRGNERMEEDGRAGGENGVGEELEVPSPEQIVDAAFAHRDGDDEE